MFIQINFMETISTSTQFSNQSISKNSQICCCWELIQNLIKELEEDPVCQKYQE